MQSRRLALCLLALALLGTPIPAQYNHLDAVGSKTVTVNGNMTAGNQVRIERDFQGQHSKLTVAFDDRIATGAVSLPGLPGSDPNGAGWSVASWREVAVP